MVFEAKYNLFGAAVEDVLAYLPGAGFGDVAAVSREVQAGSTTTTVVVDSSVGFQAGDRVHVLISGHSEVRVIDAVLSGTSFSVTQAFSSAPGVGSIVDNGPECVWRELVRAESFVISKLPERYRRMIGRVEGEIVVDSAEEGQNSAEMGLAAASNVKLYKNFAGMLNELSPADEMGDSLWSVDGQSITFDPALVEADRVLASYDVTMGTVCILQTLVVDLATFRIGRGLVGQFDRATPEWLMSFRDRGEKTLEEIFSTGRGVAELDSPKLYEDWERPNRGIRCGVVEKG